MSCNAVDEGCNIVDEGGDPVDEGSDPIDEGGDPVDEDHEVVVGDVIFAGTRILDIGRKAVSGGDVFADARIIDMGCKTIDGGEIVAGARAVDVGHEAVDMGCKVVDEDDALAGMATSASMSSVTFSPPAATSVSSVSCPLAPLSTFPLSSKFLSPLISPVRAELHERAAMVWIFVGGCCSSSTVGTSGNDSTSGCACSSRVLGAGW